MYFFRATSPSTILSICECINGSPPGIETIGVPHSSTALKLSSGDSSVFRICAGYWILPQPAHARLQRNSGSSISTNGYRSRPINFCFRTYVATVHACDTGTGMLPLVFLCFGLQTTCPRSYQFTRLTALSDTLHFRAVLPNSAILMQRKVLTWHPASPDEP